jgi:S-adenosylmethionine synthetase
MTYAPGDSYIFSSESVSEGHPDKLADRISDRVLDHFLSLDPKARVACETLVTHNFVCIAGETRSQVAVDEATIERLAREVIRETGYDGFDARFGHASAVVEIKLQPQAFEIANAVDAKSSAELQGAGDQGLMFGYATDETPSLMPAPITYAHALVRDLARARKAKEVPWLRPDAKSQVSVRYDDGRPTEIARIVVSTQHDTKVAQQAIRDYVVGVLLPKEIPASLLPKGWPDRVLVNPSGAFTEGGPATDTGLTGRKIIVDTYGGFARHGGGAFSGKDPSKVDRSAAYAARWVAKNIVAAELASRCEVQLAYAIAVREPVSIMVESFGTSSLSRAELDARVRAAFDLTPFGICRDLKLERPIYYATAAYGHFGRTVGEVPGGFTWEEPSRRHELQGATAGAAR